MLAETETDIDLALESAVTGERIAVEVKARASFSDYQDYSAGYAAMVGFDRLYFVTHSVIPELGMQNQSVGGGGVKFWEAAASQNAQCTAAWLSG